MKPKDDGRAWRAIRWAWVEYKEARVVRNGSRMIETAFRIRVLQETIGVRRSTFSELGLGWPQTLDPWIAPTALLSDRQSPVMTG